MRKHKLLILGGTQFLGRDFIESIHNDAALDITLFNRGKSNLGLFPKIKLIKGDRQSDDIFVLTKQNWDTIIDFSCYYPYPFEEFIDKLKGRVRRYIFISTISVYPFQFLAGDTITENSEVVEYGEEDKTDDSDLTYGKRKVACEDILVNSGLDTIILRPALVYGNYDPTDRLYYWLYRIKNSSKIFLPVSGKDHMSLTYVKDLSEMITRSIYTYKHDTIYNAVSHAQSLRSYLESIKKQLNSPVEFHNITMKEIKSKKIIPGKDIPLWFGFDIMVSNDKIKRDLDLNPQKFASSIKETCEYYLDLSWPIPTAGMSIEEEKKVFENCRAQ